MIFTASVAPDAIAAGRWHLPASTHNHLSLNMLEGQTDMYKIAVMDLETRAMQYQFGAVILSDTHPIAIWDVTGDQEVNNGKPESAWVSEQIGQVKLVNRSTG